MKLEAAFKTSEQKFNLEFEEKLEINKVLTAEDKAKIEAFICEKLNEGLETKLDKTTAAYKIYGTGANGQYLLDWGYNATANTIPRRLLDGNIALPLKPTEAKHATPKAYVDGLVKPLEDRVADLESLTLSYHEITSTDYEKAVPAEVGKYALLKMLGGASEKVASKNLLNPENIQLEYMGGVGGSPEIIVDNDGYTTITVRYENGLGVVVSFGSDFSIGSYYVLTEVDEQTRVFYFGNSVSLECYLPEDAKSETGYVDEYTFKFRLMVYKYEDSDTVEFTEAPEGTVFEPYFEPYFKNADVEKIESLGKNRVPSDVMVASSWEKYADTWWRYPLDFLSDGWYCISLKVKEEHSGSIYLYLQKSIDGGKTYSSASGTAYNERGYQAFGYLVTDAGLYVPALWFKVDKKAGIIYRLTFFSLTQSRLDQVYDIQIERANLTQEPSASYLPSKYAPATDYVPYKAEPIDSITIPEAVRSKEGYGREGSYIEWVDGVATLKVTKDENLEALAEPIVTDITDLFSEDNKLKVECGGAIRFVNEYKMPVPNTIAYVTRKG